MKSNDELGVQSPAHDYSSCQYEGNAKQSIEDLQLNEDSELVLTESERFDVIRIDSLDKIPERGFAILETLPCVEFVDARMPDFVNIRNNCDERKMVTIRWTGRTYEETLSYRLPRSWGRLIRIRGLGGTMIAEGPWDFTYGTDVINNMLLIEKPINGGILWYLRNTTRHYVCFKVDIWRDGEYYGYSTGIAKPVSSSTRVYFSRPGENSVVYLNTARADPH